MKKNVNKSAVIRDLLAKNPSMSASEIVAQLSKNGTPVSAPLVYQVLRKIGVPTKSSGKKRGPKPGAKAKAAAGVSIAHSNDDLFASMQTFVSAAGGLNKAIEILSVFKN